MMDFRYFFWMEFVFVWVEFCDWEFIYLYLIFNRIFILMFNKIFTF